jgi:hypothetical protein
MEPKKIGDNVSIALIGSFNPAIFHPAWFQHFGLIPATEAENAKVDVVSTDVAIFKLKWLQIQVLRDRFFARTIDESQYGPLRDLVVGTFRLLEHTPVKQMGLNRDILYDVKNEACWHSVGHALAPKEIWSKYVKNPGMKSLSIEALRNDEHKGAINITVSPVPGKKNGVEIATNSHFEFGEETMAIDVMKIVEEYWEKTLDFSLKLAQGIMSDILEKKS